MAKKKPIDLKKLVEDAEVKNPKNPVSDLKVYTVEPVIKPQNKGKKLKGKIKNEGKKPPKKSGGKANRKTIKKSKKKVTTGEKGGVAIRDREGESKEGEGDFKGYGW